MMKSVDKYYKQVKPDRPENLAMNILSCEPMPLPRALPDWLLGMPADICDVYQYWDAKRGDRRMPSRADIDPIDLKHFLPSIMLIDVVGDDRLYVYRLVGTREVRLRGRDPTGGTVAENFFGSCAKEAMRNYDRVVSSGQPWLDAGACLSADERFLDLEALFLPLSSDGAEVDKILVYTVQRAVDLP